MQPLVANGSVLQEDDVPVLEFDDEGRRKWGAPYQRAAWIAERMALGMWHGTDAQKCADVWGLSISAVELDVTVASRHLQMLTGDIQRLEVATAQRIQQMSLDRGVDPNVQLKAGELFLKLTGALKGGREETSLTGAERDASIVEWLRDPDDHGVALIREALAAPGPGLVAVLDEYFALQTQGESR